MNARSTPSPVSKGSAALQPVYGDDAAAYPGSASPEGRACCCAATPTVRVVMPLSAARPHATDLLLCAHHYLVSRRALETAQAIVSTLPGTSADVATWIATTCPRPRRSEPLAAPAAPGHDERGASIIGPVPGASGLDKEDER
jgi:hypothetical protein